MTIPPPTPVAAVHAWWQAMQGHDLSLLHELTAEDYLASGGPTGRTTNRDALIAEAEVFFGETTRIDAWSVGDLVTRDLGDVVICAYDWSETGDHGGEPFAFAGAATDVLVRRGTGWVHQAHHVTLHPSPAGARP